jgi:hypothetical protein
VEVASIEDTATQAVPFQFQALPVPAEDVGFAGVSGTFALTDPEYQFVGVKALL